MCVIKFNVVVTGTPASSMEGQYRNMDSPMAPWQDFQINILDQKTPDIQINGTYELQVRVKYADNSYSDWTDSSIFTVGDCTQSGNLYAPWILPMACTDIEKSDFTTVLFSDNPQSGLDCYSVEIGDTMYEDSALTIPTGEGKYIMRGSFNGCFPGLGVRFFDVNSAGVVINTGTCI